MSLYTFATETFTTPADRKRRPALDKGQAVRTLVFCVLALFATTLVMHRAHAAERGFHGFVEGLWPQAHKRGVSRATFHRAFEAEGAARGSTRIS